MKPHLVARVRMRKAEQLGLFGHMVTVAGHTRQTAHGVEHVAPHQRHQHGAAPHPEAPPAAAPPAAPAPPKVDPAERLQVLDRQLDRLTAQADHHRRNRNPVPAELKAQIEANKREYAELTGKGSTTPAAAGSSPAIPTATTSAAPLPAGPKIPEGLAPVPYTARIRVLREEKLAHREDGVIVEYGEPVECTVCGTKCTTKVFHMSNGEHVGKECQNTLVQLSDVAASRGYQVTPEEATRLYGHANGRQLAYLQRQGIVSGTPAEPKRPRRSSR